MLQTTGKPKESLHVSVVYCHKRQDDCLLARAAVEFEGKVRLPGLTVQSAVPAQGAEI